MRSFILRTTATIGMVVALAAAATPNAAADCTWSTQGPYATYEACEAARPGYTAWPDDYAFACESTPYGWFFRVRSCWYWAPASPAAEYPGHRPA